MGRGTERALWRQMKLRKVTPRGVSTAEGTVPSGNQTPKLPWHQVPTSGGVQCRSALPFALIPGEPTRRGCCRPRRVWSAAGRGRREPLCQALPVQQLRRDWQRAAAWAAPPAPRIYGI